jgi:molecular chaperone GrpE
MTAPDDMGNGPVVHDHRRIDPVTGQARRGKHAASKPAGTSGAGRGPDAAAGADPRHGKDTDTPGPDDEATVTVQGEAHVAEGTASAPGRATTSLEIQLAERTADLQRLQAEYANYRKRVDRDRAAVKEYAVAGVLSELLPVLDAIGQARDHGELSGGFKSVADALQAAVSKLGLVAYGEKGEAFDPKIHEALAHSYSPDVAEDTCVEILQPGYKVGERVLRPARVAVAEPATGPDGSSNGDTYGDPNGYDTD